MTTTGFEVEWSRDAPVASCRRDHRSYLCVKIEDDSGKLFREFEQLDCFESQRSQELTELDPEKSYTAEVKAKTFIAGSYTQPVYSDSILLISNTRLLLVGAEERVTDVSAEFTFPLSALQLHSGVPQFFIACRSGRDLGDTQLNRNFKKMETSVQNRLQRIAN